MAKSPYADVPEPLRSQLPGMFSSYPKLCEAAPSSWIQWGKDKVISYHAKVCHADMYYQGSGYDELVTAVPKNDEVSLEYIRMLIRGPFRSVSDLIKLDRIKNNYYLHCLSLSKWPANVLLNFCIASRVPIEFDYLLSPWAKRCELGFDPILAFLLTYSYGGKDCVQSSKRTFKFDRPGHLWFDAASSWPNILHGVMEKQSRPYKTHPGDCKPSNIIWGHNSDYQVLSAMTDDEIAAFYTTRVEVYEQPAPPPVIFKKMKNAFPHGLGPMPAAVQQFIDAAHQAHNPAGEVPIPWPKPKPKLNYVGAGWADLHHQDVEVAVAQPEPLPEQPVELIHDEAQPLHHFDFDDDF